LNYRILFRKTDARFCGECSRVLQPMRKAVQSAIQREQFRRFEGMIEREFGQPRLSRAK
jgi:hypothetical protein